MELVRKILLAVAANERPLESVMVRIAGYMPEQVGEHIRLLHEAHLLEGTATMGPDRRPRWSELRLTWWGHDFIDCARNDTVWRSASEAIGPNNGAASLDTWRNALIESAFLILGRMPDGRKRPAAPEEQGPAAG